MALLGGYYGSLKLGDLATGSMSREFKALFHFKFAFSVPCAWMKCDQLASCSSCHLACISIFVDAKPLES